MVSLYAVMSLSGLSKWFFPQSLLLNVQGQEISYGHIIELGVHRQYTEEAWSAQTVEIVSSLYFCESYIAPEYNLTGSSIHDL